MTNYSFVRGLAAKVLAKTLRRSRKRTLIQTNLKGPFGERSDSPTLTTVFKVGNCKI